MYRLIRSGNCSDEGKHASVCFTEEDEQEIVMIHRVAILQEHMMQRN